MMITRQSIVPGLFVVVAATMVALPPALAFSELTEGSPPLVESEQGSSGLQPPSSQPPRANAAALHPKSTVKRTNPFDYSKRIIPPSELPIRRAPAQASGDVPLEEQVESNETISVTPDGQEETFSLPPQAIEEIRGVMEQINKEKKIKLNQAPSEPVATSVAALVTSPNNSGFVWKPDTRTQVTNTTAHPFRTVGLVGFESGGCSGTMIGPHHVLTSGHCIYNIKTNQWYKNLEFYPGRDGEQEFYGKFGWKRLFSVKGWTDQHQQDLDFGVVILDADAGNDVGWLSFGYQDPMPRYNVNIVGYPGDEPAGTMWHAYCPLEATTETLLQYRCGTAPGSSGSSVFVYWTEKKTQTVYGVNSYEYTDGSGPNFGPRINKTRFEVLKSWLNGF